MKTKVVWNKDAVLETVGEGVARKVLAYLPEQMIVEVRFEKGAVGAPHRHRHTQCTYVMSGAFRFTVEGRAFDVAAGDTLAFASEETHGCVCVEAGTLIDVFTPMREDFLSR